MGEETAVTFEMIAKALFENYECIYDIDLNSCRYKTYFQSETYRELKLSREGENFFEALPNGVRQTIAEEDQAYVLANLDKAALIAGVSEKKYHTIVYQIQRNGEKIFHQLRATLQPVEHGMHILMGVKNIDDLVRRQEAHHNAMEAMLQKERNHMEAVLASAAAYLEANLSRDILLEKSVGHLDGTGARIMDVPPVTEIPVYEQMQRWIAKYRVVENRDKYLEISSRQYLLDCFRRREKRASVSFSVKGQDGGSVPCRAVFYLYQERATGDVHVFCVIYDLTQQQRKEKELEELERELLLSRIRNSTSQMQPHFLYNALGSIQEVILIDPGYASELLGDFTVHLRSCVRAMTKDEPIPFAEELKNIRAYVNIEKMRLGNRLQVEYDIRSTAFYILPLCIQPLVENAIRHGIYRRGKQGGTVQIRTGEDDEDWIVQVEDDGIGFDIHKFQQDLRERKRDSTGIINIRFRLEKVMGARVELRSQPGTGTVATIRVPKGEKRKNESYHR